MEDENSDFENRDTSEQNGCCLPITTSPEDELNLHTDREIKSREIETENIRTKNEKVRRSNRER